jgi:flagellar biosynthesis protein FlhG
MLDDQASGLRRLFLRRSRRPLGVGGADATPVVFDLARALAELESRVLVIDRTRGEVAARFNARVRYELAHVVDGDRRLDDVLIDGPAGVTVLPAARGLDELALSADPVEGGWQRRLSSWLVEARRDFDVWLINGLPPAGGDADILLAVAPTAQGITCAYAQIKALAHCQGQRSFGVVVHQAACEATAQATFTRVATTARRFLCADVDYRGRIPAESRARSERQQALLGLARSIVHHPTPG